MVKKIDGGKFGLEIPALTEARVMAEAESYSPQSRTKYHGAMEENRALINQVVAFLEENGAVSVSGCGYSLFGVLTSEDDPKAPCGISFRGSSELAQAVATAFPSNKVISANDGAPVAPAVIQTAMLKQIKRKPRL